jgi:ATP-binding cassette, subfamily C (CFTR/MRP), member 4
LITGTIFSFFMSSIFSSRQSVEVETQMTAVERVVEYCSLKQEPPAQLPSKKRPPTDWPSRGQIVFDHVSMSYSDDEHSTLALHDISLTIEGGEKIGIVGRTGAGKSSFIQILFRMGYLTHGQIMIDQINIESVGLDDVRSRLSIIPQDPVLFAGSMRSNLDPFHHHSDDQIWVALEQVRQQIERSVLHVCPLI